MSRVILSFLFAFSSIIISQAQNNRDTLSARKDSQQVLLYVGKMPSFNGGGDDVFTKYIQSKLIYPKEAIRNNIEGNLFIEFIVEEDGSMSNIMVMKRPNQPTPDPLLTEAAIKAFKDCPKWEPGKNNGVPVRIRKIIPVSFKLK
jgi:protein TonB